MEKKKTMLMITKSDVPFETKRRYHEMLERERWAIEESKKGYMIPNFMVYKPGDEEFEHPDFNPLNMIYTEEERKLIGKK